MTFANPKSRPRRAVLDKMKAERTGCVRLLTSQQTKTLVGLYRALEAGIEKDPSTPWALLCEGTTDEPHDGVLPVEEYNTARYLLSKPLEWCPYCQDKKARDDRAMEEADGGGSSEGDGV